MYRFLLVMIMTITSCSLNSTESTRVRQLTLREIMQQCTNKDAVEGNTPFRAPSTTAALTRKPSVDVLTELAELDASCSIL